VFWPSSCVSFSLQKDASTQVPYANFASVTERSFEAWESVRCGSNRQAPSLRFDNLGAVTCNEPGFQPAGSNANIIMFRDKVWPYAGNDNTLALTTLTYNLETGEIFDADMEINSTPQNRITYSDTKVEADLQSILTHEIGHFIGIAHSSDQTATMYAKYDKGTTEIRTLSADDRAAVCFIYPPDRKTAGCNAAPPGGFASLCNQPASTSPSSTTQEESCSVHYVGIPTTSSSLATFGVTGLLLVLTRRVRKTSAQHHMP